MERRCVTFQSEMDCVPASSRSSERLRLEFNGDLTATLTALAASRSVDTKVLLSTTSTPDTVRRAVPQASSRRSRNSS